ELVIMEECGQNTLGSTYYKQSLHKKISPLSRSLGTAVEVDRDRLSLTDSRPFHFAPMMVSLGLNRAHNNDTTIIKDVRCVVGFIQPETVNESSKITNTCYDIDMGQQMVHEKQLAISIPSGDYLTTSKNLSSLRENSSEIVNILPHNTGCSVISTSPSLSTDTSSDILTEKIRNVNMKHTHSCTRARSQRDQDHHSQKKFFRMINMKIEL
ncbi:2635_t:CDS:2, partial [Rhizophagus irregularis]